MGPNSGRGDDVRPPVLKITQYVLTHYENSLLLSDSSRTFQDCVCTHSDPSCSVLSLELSRFYHCNVEPRTLATQQNACRVVILSLEIGGVANVMAGGKSLTNPQEAFYLFFRSRPHGPTAGSLTSSLQTIETTFLLIALMRYPHAITSCASAIESIIKASPSCKTSKQGLKALLEGTKNRVGFIRNAPIQN